MGNIVHSTNNKYKIVLIKTIENVEPVYYKIVNLGNYKTLDIPAYRFLDIIVNDKYEVINLKLKNNGICIINSDGYESTDEIIIIDEFDNEVDNIYKFCLSHGDMGSEIIQRYSVDNNKYSLSNYRIDSEEKLAWTCEDNHTIYCSFATYFGVGGTCPICEAKKMGSSVSFRYWAKLTNNKLLLDAYDEAESLNSKSSRDIAWNSKKLVSFLINKKEVKEKLCDVTSGKVKLPLVD